MISQFVDKSWLIREQSERDHYLRLLGRALAQSDWMCIAFALMSSHIHLALVAGRSSLDSWIRSVHSPFASWLNAKYDRRGPVFAERPESPCIKPGDVARVVAYIHNNPVKAGVVGRARDTHWTSHRAYLGLQTIPWLASDEGMRRCGFEDPTRFDAWVDDQASDELPNLELERGRRAVRQLGGIELATPTLGGEVPLVAHVGAHVRASAKRVVEMTASVLGVPIDALCSKVRPANATLARRVAARAGLALGIPGSRLAAALGMSPQLVSRRQHEPIDPALEPIIRLIVDRVRSELPRTA